MVNRARICSVRNLLSRSPNRLAQSKRRQRHVPIQLPTRHHHHRRIHHDVHSLDESRKINKRHSTHPRNRVTFTPTVLTLFPLCDPRA